MKTRSRALTLISLVIGLALFVFLVSQVGLAEILARVESLGAGFLLILAISSIRQLARSLAWLRCMTPEDRQVGVFTVLRARLGGDAIGDLTTAGPLIAEPLKVMTFGRRLPMAALVSSLAVENLAYAFSSCVMVIAGTLALLAAFTVPDSLRTASWVAIGLVLVVLVGSVVVVRLRRSLISALSAATLRLLKRERQWGEKLERVREMEAYVFDFYARRPLDFLLVTLLEMSFHLAGVIEIYVTLKLIGYAPTLAVAFILEAVNRVINIVFAFVPAVVGVDEAGTGLLATTLGLGATAGVTLAIIRKARIFFWIGVGLIFLAFRRSEVKEEAGERVEAKG
ncbi:MAG TPA: lysylphosphatidylglycerol synthase domain-containing protein [Blastocatellia bacterium]|nr:lysylphosphatidylglycerol synthase domain-containing protein [Blastocatellia bacterium]